MNEELQKKVRAIEARNKRVEADKAWETSGARTLLIFVITYIIAAVWLMTINDSNPLLKALVPALGWYLSTLTIPFIKTWWIKTHMN